MSQVPRVIWMNWFQGWRKAPPLVEACAESWRRRNPEWTVVQLDDSRIGSYVDLTEAYPGVDLDRLTPQSRSNLLRMALLHRYGGVWADATLWCVQPLREWLESVTGSGFFAFRRPEPDRPLANWFLAAAPEHPVIDRWMVASRDRWAGPCPPTFYTWHHATFVGLLEQNESIRDMWARTPVLDAPRLMLPPAHLSGELDPDLANKVSRGLGPVLKLNHRVPPLAGGDTLAGYFCDYWQPLEPPRTIGEWLARRAREGVVSIVQVGANDGRHGDPLHRFAMSHRGETSLVLIEPQGAIVGELAASYADHPAARIINAAVGEGPHLTLYSVAPWAWGDCVVPYGRDWPTYRAPTGITSGTRELVAGWLRKHYVGEASLDEVIVTSQVPSASLEYLLRQAELPLKVDALLVDVEGWDDHVLQQCGIDRLRPGLIRFEKSHIGKERVRTTEEWLWSLSYRTRHEGRHVIATRARRSVAA